MAKTFIFVDLENPLTLYEYIKYEIFSINLEFQYKKTDNAV